MLFFWHFYSTYEECNSISQKLNCLICPSHTYQEGKTAGIRCFLQGHSADTRLEPSFDFAQVLILLNHASWQVAQRNCGVSTLGGTLNLSRQALSHLSCAGPALSRGGIIPEVSFGLNYSVISSQDFPVGAELHPECLSYKNLLSSSYSIAKHQSFSLLTPVKESNTSAFEK